MEKNQEKINNEIQCENYISAVKLLLEEFKSSNDPDNLEKISTILSPPQIINSFNNEFLDELNKLLIRYNFNQIERGTSDYIGFAEFPAVGDDNNFNSIRAIVVSDGNKNIDIDAKIKNKRALFHTIRYLQDEIQKNLCDLDSKTRDVTILNWGLTFSIREHLLKNTNLGPNNPAINISGSSLHFAAVVACVSKIFNLPVNQHYVFTGSFNEKGEAQSISDFNKKVELISKERPNIQKIFIPKKSSFSEADQKSISLFDKFVEIENVLQLIEKVFNKSLNEISTLNLDARKRLGKGKIWAEYFHEKELIFKKEYLDDIKEKKNCLVFHFRGEDHEILPLKKIYGFFPNSTPNFIILEGKLPNQYTGNIVGGGQYKQFSGILGSRKGTSNNVIVFTAPQGDAKSLVGYECNFDF